MKKQHKNPLYQHLVLPNTEDVWEEIEHKKALITLNKKHYAVWVGVNPGVYSDWEEAKEQVNGFPNAKYKSFASKALAEKAFLDGFEKHVKTKTRSV